MWVVLPQLVNANFKIETLNLFWVGVARVTEIVTGLLSLCESPSFMLRAEAEFSRERRFKINYLS